MNNLSTLHQYYWIHSRICIIFIIQIPLLMVFNQGLLLAAL
jgi:hypothetical protein